MEQRSTFPYSQIHDLSFTQLFSLVAAMARWKTEALDRNHPPARASHRISSILPDECSGWRPAARLPPPTRQSLSKPRP